MILGVFLFFLGLAIGSFLNSFLYRYETQQKFTGRSFCPNCKHQIAWYDNIPLLSYLILRGKCRHCKKKISVQYPVIEALTGITFLLIGLYSTLGNNLSIALLQIPNNKFQITNILELILLLFIASLLLLIAMHDAKTKEIPNGFNLLFILSSFSYLMLSNAAQNKPLLATSYWLLAGVAAFLFFWSLVFFSKETWMGGGDAKLALGMGILLGPANTFLAILIASWTGATYGVITLLKSKDKKSTLSESRMGRKFIKLKKNRLSTFRFPFSTSGHAVPFGPFLVLGTLVSFLFGSQIVDWYVKIVLGM